MGQQEDTCAAVNIPWQPAQGKSMCGKQTDKKKKNLQSYEFVKLYSKRLEYFWFKSKSHMMSV